MTDLAAPTGADGRRLQARGARTRAKLLAAAQDVFTDLGYHEASIVKITEAAGVAQGTFYLYFGSKQDVFEEVVLDLNRRVRHYVNEAAKEGTRGSSARCSASEPTSASRPRTRRSTA